MNGNTSTRSPAFYHSIWQTIGQDLHLLKFVLSVIVKLEEITEIEQQLISVKQITKEIKKMSWKNGSIKQSYDGDLWRSLEALTYQLHSLEYKPLNLHIFPTIVKDIIKLQSLIQQIIGDLEQNDNHHQKIIDKLLNQSTLYSEEFFFYPGCKFTQNYSRFFADLRYLKKMHYLVNLDFFQQAANAITTNQSSSYSLIYKYALFRVLEFLGENSVVISPFTKNLAESSIAWESLHYLRNDLVHADGDLSARKRLELILQNDPMIAKLLKNILISEFGTMSNVLDEMQQYLLSLVEHADLKKIADFFHSLHLADVIQLDETPSELSKLAKFIGHLQDKNIKVHIEESQFQHELEKLVIILEDSECEPQALELAIEYSLSKLGEMALHLLHNYDFRHSINQPELDLLTELVNKREQLMHELDEEVTIGDLPAQLVSIMVKRGIT